MEEESGNQLDQRLGVGSEKTIPSRGKELTLQIESCLNRLTTRDLFILSWAYKGVFCRNYMDSRDNILFERSFAKRILRAIQNLHFVDNFAC